ncbi:MAG: hypothetical protein H6734_06705 [Alphaproteobacteria bacterium]|nr:hypothetical protein [Alphaproteobacteria bacterium]
MIPVGAALFILLVGDARADIVPPQAPPRGLVDRDLPPPAPPPPGGASWVVPIGVGLGVAGVVAVGTLGGLGVLVRRRRAP